MAETVPEGTWVEIWRVLLPPGERAPQVPADTRRHRGNVAARLVGPGLAVKGYAEIYQIYIVFLVSPGLLGTEVEIVTPAGRRLRGLLAEVNPAYRHGFGSPIPELSAVGGEVRRLLRERRDRR